jgi:hypothetical protein
LIYILYYVKHDNTSFLCDIQEYYTWKYTKYI